MTQKCYDADQSLLNTIECIRYSINIFLSYPSEKCSYKIKEERIYENFETKGEDEELE